MIVGRLNEIYGQNELTNPRPKFPSEVFYFHNTIPLVYRKSPLKCVVGKDKNQRSIATFIIISAEIYGWTGYSNQKINDARQSKVFYFHNTIPSVYNNQLPFKQSNNVNTSIIHVARNEE
jgi:hypothetical protein